jgi:hypothetical protein
MVTYFLLGRNDDQPGTCEQRNTPSSAQ